MPKVIEVKSDPEIFQMHWIGDKNFDMREIRNRNFQPRDILYLREFDRLTKKYSGRTIRALILMVMRGPMYEGLNAGNCIMSLHPRMIKSEGDFFGKAEA